MEASVVAGVGIPEEFDRQGRRGGPPSIRVRMLGPLTIQRDGDLVTLPGSRKVRALFAFLALAPRPVTRSQLCELLWDVPNDPRGELRWCLSKVRGILDAGGLRRVQTRGDTISLDLSDCFVDALEVAGATGEGIEMLPAERQRALSALFAGEFLEGLEIDRSPLFDGWLTAQRRRYRARHVALLEHLVKRVPDNEALGYLEKWRELAPFDPNVHELLLGAFARRGQIREGEEHLAATARLFEAEGLESRPAPRGLAISKSPRRGDAERAQRGRVVRGGGQQRPHLHGISPGLHRGHAVRRSIHGVGRPRGSGRRARP